jgi:hypothetical protein
MLDPDQALGFLTCFAHGGEVFLNALVANAQKRLAGVVGDLEKIISNRHTSDGLAATQVFQYNNCKNSFGTLIDDC